MSQLAASHVKEEPGHNDLQELEQGLQSTPAPRANFDDSTQLTVEKTSRPRDQQDKGKMNEIEAGKKKQKLDFPAAGKEAQKEKFSEEGHEGETTIVNLYEGAACARCLTLSELFDDPHWWIEMGCERCRWL